MLGGHGKAHHTVRHSKMLIQTICNLTYWWLHDCYNLFMGMTKNTRYFMLRKNCLFLIDKVVLFACFIWYTRTICFTFSELFLSHTLYGTSSHFADCFAWLNSWSPPYTSTGTTLLISKFDFPWYKHATGNVWSKIYCELHFD